MSWRHACEFPGQRLYFDDKTSDGRHDAERNNTRYNDSQHDDTQHDNTQNSAPLRRMPHYNIAVDVVVLAIATLSVVLPSDVRRRVAAASDGTSARVATHVAAI
jgi:hypothetical protein